MFVKGFRTFAPRAGAPDFVLGQLVVTLDDFKEFVNGEAREYISDYNGKKQLRIDILEKKEGGINFTVNTYKKDDIKGVESSQETKDLVEKSKEVREKIKQVELGEYPEDDLPFIFTIPILPLIGLGTMALSVLCV